MNSQDASRKWKSKTVISSQHTPCDDHCLALSSNHAPRDDHCWAFKVAITLRVMGIPWHHAERDDYYERDGYTRRLHFYPATDSNSSQRAYICSRLDWSAVTFA